MRIVVGYIATAQGRAALETAIAEAQLRDGEVHVVSSMRGDEDGQRFIDQREALEQATAKLDAAAVAHTVHDFARDQSPAQDLLQTAEEVGAQLLVIGIRKRSAVGKLVLGSNAAEVLMHAACPVLAVKPQGDDG
ncbi:MAG TPA: universal stress protein [Nitriliruptorales bacterium]